MPGIISPTQPYVDPSIVQPQPPPKPAPLQPLAGPDDPNARLAVAPRMKARANAQASAGAWTPQTTANMQGWPQAIMSAKAGYQPPRLTPQQSMTKLMRGY